ncbi:hypothetical protein Cpir12675_002138 [Ceratocystis pirilliformis]|uniref:Cupin type-2 domain-containing protein n=1 Tax=Ceratocystis pirilliformis TaxID=259994 RepID=A0ABR3ZCH6_9PEZI
MSTLMPLLKDLLPMIMPSSVHIQKAPALSSPSSPPPSPHSHPNSKSSSHSRPHAKGREPGSPSGIPPTSPTDSDRDSAAPPRDVLTYSTDAQASVPVNVVLRAASAATESSHLRSVSPAYLADSRIKSSEDESDLDGLDYTDRHTEREAERARMARASQRQSPLRVTNKLVNRSDYMCASAVELDAHANTSIRHHSEQETIIYVISGALILSTKPDLEGDVITNVISRGDFVSIPPWTEHQLRNDSDEKATWLAMRNASSPVTVDLVDWGEEEVDSSLDSDSD